MVKSPVEHFLSIASPVRIVKHAEIIETKLCKYNLKQTKMWCRLQGRIWVQERGLGEVGGSEAADVGEALELLREVVLVEDWIGAVLDHLQRHRAEHRCKLVDAFRSVGDEQNKKQVHGDLFIFWGMGNFVFS